jgi:hypothetical protein
MKSRLSVGFVTVFYLFLAALAWGLAAIFGDLDLLVWHNKNATSVYFDAGLGVAVGLITVAASQVLDRTTSWAQELGREFGKVLGPIDISAAFIFATASAIGEELLFRGFLQQILSVSVFGGPYGDWIALIAATVVFGLLHMGPDIKKFWPWTVMALLLGGVFGWMYLYTGNILAPMLAHFTVNFFNLQAIGRRYGDAGEEDAGQ